MSGYDYANSLFDGLDLTRKAGDKDFIKKSPEKSVEKSVQVRALSEASKTVEKPKVSGRAPWGGLSQEDSDYFIPDEYLYGE